MNATHGSEMYIKVFVYIFLGIKISEIHEISNIKIPKMLEIMLFATLLCACKKTAR